MTGRERETDGDGESAVNRRAALEIADGVAAELESLGAAAVVLMGSFARGTQGPHSDLDIVAIGPASDAWLEIRDGLLVSVSVATPDEIEYAFLRPERVGCFIPGWRDAVILRDRDGSAARNIRRAREWSWDELDAAACDRHVARELCGLAEEAHKLVNLLLAGNPTGAAIQRNLLATRLAVILAVHLRLLYDSENDLWTLVNERMGPEWANVQARALGLGGEAFAITCNAALELYRLACAAARQLFDERQLAVVERALAVADQLPGEDAS